MTSLVRETRTRLGLTVKQLGEMMGTSATSVSSLERNEDAGTVKTGTIERALEAMGKVPVTIVVSAAEFDRVEQAKRRARRIAKKVTLTMSLEDQAISPEDTERIYERALLTGLERL